MDLNELILNFIQNSKDPKDSWRKKWEYYSERTQLIKLHNCQETNHDLYKSLLLTETAWVIGREIQVQYFPILNGELI